MQRHDRPGDRLSRDSATELPLEELAAQTAGHAMADWIAEHPGEPGKGGVRILKDRTTVLVYWKGTVPADLLGLAADQALQVTFKPAPYSRAELKRSDGHRHRNNTGIVTVIASEPDYSSIVIGLTSKAPPNAIDEVKTATDIPIKLRGIVAPKPLAATPDERGRPYDSAPVSMTLPPKVSRSTIGGADPSTPTRWAVPAGCTPASNPAVRSPGDHTDPARSPPRRRTPRPANDLCVCCQHCVSVERSLRVRDVADGHRNPLGYGPMVDVQVRSAGNSGPVSAPPGCWWRLLRGCSSPAPARAHALRRPPMHQAHIRSKPVPPQIATLWLAGALISLACFGFLTRLARYVDSLATWIPASGSFRFGLFHLSLALNVVHLLLGAAALIVAGSAAHCVPFLATTGVAFLVLVGYGQLEVHPILPDLIPTSSGSIWLHVVLALSAITAGLATARHQRSPSH